MLTDTLDQFRESAAKDVENLPGNAERLDGCEFPSARSAGQTAETPMSLKYLEFCDDLTSRTMCGTTCAPARQEVRDADAYRPVSECRH